jgi:hypothetical protein
MPIHFLEPLNRGWARMKTALFRPFDIHKWFVVGFNAFLAALMEGSNSGGSGRIGKNGSFAEFIHFPREAWAWFQSHPAWTALILFGIVVAVAVMVALTWVSSRGVFMFLDNVVHDRVEVARPWREYEKQGNSLFVWRLLFGLVTFVIFGALFAAFFIRGAAIYDSGQDIASYLPLIAGLGLLALAIVLVWGFIGLFLKDFVAALMYKHRVSCGRAWRMFLDVFKKAPIHFIGYGLLVFVLSIMAVIAVALIGFGTCCIGFFLLIIPYINVVATLPIWYTYRAFSLEFLAQFGPDCDVFPKKAAEVPAAPAV